MFLVFLYLNINIAPKIVQSKNIININYKLNLAQSDIDETQNKKLKLENNYSDKYSEDIEPKNNKNNVQTTSSSIDIPQSKSTLYHLYIPSITLYKYTNNLQHCLNHSEISF